MYAHEIGFISIKFLKYTLWHSCGDFLGIFTTAPLSRCLWFGNDFRVFELCGLCEMCVASALDNGLTQHPQSNNCPVAYAYLCSRSVIHDKYTSVIFQATNGSPSLLAVFYSHEDTLLAVKKVKFAWK